MPLPRNIFAPAFRHRRLGLLFAFLVGITVYLASFATVAEAALSMVTFSWDKGMENRLTVEVPSVDDEVSVPQTDRVQQVLSVLRAMPEVDKVTQVPDEETARLLKPWISQPELLKALPVPVLIDVERKSDSHLTPDDIESRLKNIVSDVHVDDHGAWLADLTHLVRGLSAIAALIIVLTGTTLLITVALLCRTIMAAEHETISLLHVMGAEDRDIARHFQFHARRLTAAASFAGFVLAMLSAAILLFFIWHFADFSPLRPLNWLTLGAEVCLVPIAALWIAVISARISVMQLLHRMH